MEIPKHYSLHSETDSHFVIHDDRDGKTFHVAKKPLHPAHQVKILKMQKLSDGGDVGIDTERRLRQDYTGPDKIDTTPPAEQDKSLGLMSNVPDQPLGAGSAMLPPMNPMSAMESTALQNINPDTLKPNKAQIDPSMLEPTGGSPAAQSQGAPSSMGSMGPYNPLGEMEAAYGQGVDAANIGAQAQTEAAKQQAQLYQSQINDLNRLQGEHDDRMKMLTQRSDDLFNSAMQEKIDPNKYWQNHSKISAALGIILGGIGQGLMHSNSNLALQTLDNNINREVDAQKARASQNNNLYRMNLEQTHNEQEAYIQTKADLYALTAAKTNKIAAQMQAGFGNNPAMSSIIEANRLRTRYGLGMQQAQMHMQLAGMGVSREAYTNGIPPQAAMMLPEKDRNLLVRMPDGNMALASGEKAKEKYDESSVAYNSLMGQLNELKALNIAGTVLSPAQRARAESLMGTITIGLNDFAQSHRISESDIGFQKGQMSDPRSVYKFLSSDWNAQTNQLMDSLTKAHSANMVQYVPALSEKMRRSKVKQSGLDLQAR